MCICNNHKDTSSNILILKVQFVEKLISQTLKVDIYNINKVIMQTQNYMLYYIYGHIKQPLFNGSKVHRILTLKRVL